MWFNILLVLVWDTSRRRRLARRSIAASFRLFLTVAKGLGVLDYRIDGAEILRQERGLPRRSQSSHADRLRAAGISHARN